jgi:uncharacterized protein (TIGR04551 family)
MRRHLLLRSFLALLAPVGSQLVTLQAAHAQDAGAAPIADAGAAPAADTGAPAAPSVVPQPEPPAAEPEPGEPTSTPPTASPLLEPPALTPLELDPKSSAASAPAEKPKSAPPAEKRGWTAPETVFHLHGYLRMRGSLLKDGALGHRPNYDRTPLTDDENDPPRLNYDPFPFFIPEDSSNYDPLRGGSTTRPPVEGGCGENYRSDGRCNKKTQVGGDMRLRLKPEIHLSDDVRVKAWVDVLDNVGLGTLGYGPNALYGPADPELGNLIRVRRAWGEARNRDIGELRFGRMGADWGLGILDNGGDRNGIDSDFSSDLDRIMGMTNLGGFYLMAAYDWASQGKVTPGSATPSGIAVDRAQRDDLSALTIAAAHKLEPELQRSNLLRGEAVYNYGLYFIYRRQRLKNREPVDPDPQPYYRIDQSQFVPDLWFQFLWEGLRIELEAAFVAGSLEGGCPWIDADPDNRDTWRSGAEHVDVSPTSRRSSGECKFRQLGVALESEYRLFDDRLGIHFLSGFASGDAHAYGLAQTNDPSFQRSETSAADRTISTYQFHPDYRVDLILWRTLMRRVAGGYYFKPGVSYDFIHDPYGQQAGARVDVIYSRAATAKQTWGDDANLGLELDLSLYYRSEDGPDVLDGFYTTIQWGILFPFQGLQYANSIVNAPDSKSNAMILRGVMGIAF